MSLVALFLSGTAPALAGDMVREEAGRLPGGAVIEAVTLTNDNGVSARILTYGATLQSLIAPDRNGNRADVLLGYDTAAGYVETPNYFGVTVGRYANRIANGRFSIDGQNYQVPQNDGTNSLHGGGAGFDKQNWQISSATSGTTPSVVMTLNSPDGDSGYPGAVTATVTYTLDNQGNLAITFTAETTKPTVINMTNHAIFNLAGEGMPGGIEGHRLTIPAARYTPVSEILIPTGELAPVAGTPFDFRQPKYMAWGLRDGTNEQIRYGRGFDHNWALDKGLTAEPQLAARLEDPHSGRVLEVLTTEPGVQMYAGNFLDGTLVGKNGHLYRMGDGIALEPQKFPDAPNQSAFVSPRVDPGTPYRHAMIYRITTAR
ncbi:aldose epimerase family protein [Croceibacterium sp. TMG7-5b_MA50]|uniref:aldose epimerase family protein n=1 Tax=Croceibacterium sp. TMG7-5b_MA50 TaxID=3121290 RepID=UPI003221D5B9